MAVNEKISKLIANQFPDFYKEEGANFLAFMEAYYEYMEQTGKMTDAVRNLQSYQDIATTTDTFIEYFIHTFLPSVPLDVTADKKIMTKYINQFNRARGTLASYKLLFRALYNEDVEVEYPADQILKVSDGDWRIDRYLVTDYDTANYNFIGKTISGTESEAQALVEDVVRRVVRGRDLMQILVSNIKGTFNNLEPIRLITDSSATGHAPIIEAGISGTTVVTPGGQYAVGDIVDLISSDRGFFGKVVVTSTQDLLGSLSFSLNDGGSGYTRSTSGGGTEITFIGGDGAEDGSFVIAADDIVDRFALSINTDLIGSNTIYGNNAPTVTFADGADRQMTTFANTLLSSPDYGFREAGQQLTAGTDFHDHANAVLRIANTQDIKVGDSLFGVTSSANGKVLSIIDSTASNTVVRLDGYKNFSEASGGESIRSRYSNTSGNTVGTVISFSGNTIGYHVAEIGWIANTSVSPLLEGQEIVGRTSGSFGVVKKIVSLVANGYNRGVGGADDRDLYTVQVTANTTANLTSQFDTGPIKPFLENEGLRLVSSNTTVGNIVSTTANTTIENHFSLISDALNFETSTFGTIASISLPVGGSGYSVAPRIAVTEPDIAALGIGEAYLTLQSDNINFDTGNSSFTALDSNDRLVQSSSGASGDVKGGLGSSTISTTAYANGTYEMVVRVWQDFLQREPSNIIWANNATVTLNIYDSSYVPGTTDTRSIADTGTAKIVNVQDEGVLGKNADISASVGANGTITGVRVLDSGFAYKDNEIVIVETSGRAGATGATLRLDLGGVANGEGYYASTRSHISSLRGYLQDSRFYQEFSYQVISPLSLDRYRDYALELVHPAGQALFGKFRLQSNAALDIVANTASNTALLSNGTVSIAKTRASGTIAITQNQTSLTGTSTQLANEFNTVANNAIIEIDTGDGIENKWIEVTLTASDATTATLSDSWIFATQTSANIYYANSTILTGSSTNLAAEFANGDMITLQTSDGSFVKTQINTVRNNTELTLTRNWTLTDLSGANAYYTSGSI